MITYEFEIVAVNEAARCMEVVYTSAGKPIMHIGARLPYAGETLDQVVKMFAPVPAWLELDMTVQLPTVGEAGVIEPAAVVAPTQEQIMASFTASIQKRLDDFARTRNYDGILSACSYASSTSPKFKQEADYCVAKRDETWEAAYVILAEVQAETRPMPTSIADIEADLPGLVWPAP